MLGRVSKGGNNTLHLKSAKKNKNDEFYTKKLCTEEDGVYTAQFDFANHARYVTFKLSGSCIQGYQCCLHSVNNLPAYVSKNFYTHVIEEEYYYKDGRLHREGGLPAYIRSTQISYYENGLLHRLEGPADIVDKGTYSSKTYAIRGAKLSEEAVDIQVELYKKIELLVEANK